jgi:acyl dehydratase
MAKLELSSLRDLRHRFGAEAVVSGGLEVTQTRSDQRAAASGDHQSIHLDVERARRYD